MLERFLSSVGRDIQYPWNGLIAQAAEAKNAKINSTLGVFLDDDLRIGILPAVSDLVKLEPQQITEYAPSHGVKALRHLWRERLVTLGHIESPAPDKASMPVVTAGLTAGLTIAGQMFLDGPGSELIIGAPYWPNYKLIYQKIQRTPIREFPLFSRTPEGAFKTDLGALNKALSASDQTVRPDLPLVVLLNVPNNPTGYSYTQTESEQICLAFREFLETRPDRRLVVVIDDAYSGFNYEPDIRKHSFFRTLDSLHERLLAAHISGVTKEIYAWGLRVGFITFGGKGCTNHDLIQLEDKAAAFIRGSLSNVCMSSQHLAIASLEDVRTPSTHIRYFKMLANRYAACRLAMNDVSFQKYFSPMPCNSGYFLALEIKDARLTAEALRKALVESYSTGIIAIDKNLARIAFSAVSEEQIPQLFSNLTQAAQTHLAKCS